jgi:ubiquitin-protein ligase
MSLSRKHDDVARLMNPSLHRWLSDCLAPSSPSASTMTSRGEEDNSTIWPDVSNSSFLVSDDVYQEEREQALRDYKVTIEYKHLKSHAPGGVYLIPSLDDLRRFFGIIFIRRGPFTNGIFKFELILPLRYNDTNAHPEIIFTSYVFNPYVDAVTGKLDITSAYPNWDPTKHYLVTVLTFLKKIFYAKTFQDANANAEARKLAETEPAVYRQKVDECVRQSQKDVYDNAPDTLAKFTEEQLSHRVLRDLLKANVKDPAQVSKNALLSMISKASHV